MCKEVVRIGCDYFDYMGIKPFNERRSYSKTLGDVYKTASHDKIKAWNRWRLFFENEDLVDTESFGVVTHNSWHYSIGAVIYSIEHDKYYELRITANNRYAWELV